MPDQERPKQFNPTAEQRRRLMSIAEAAIKKATQKIRDFYNVPNFPEINIDYSLRGKVAGHANYNKSLDTYTIRVNLRLLAENEEDYLTVTIPHEVAHLYTFFVATNKAWRRKITPHGREWQKVMRTCFGLDPKRTHSYEVTPARVHKRPYEYICDCQSHLVTTRMHNSIKSGRDRRCIKCKVTLTFLGCPGT